LETLALRGGDNPFDVGRRCGPVQSLGKPRRFSKGRPSSGHRAGKRAWPPLPMPVGL